MPNINGLGNGGIDWSHIVSAVKDMETTGATSVRGVKESRAVTFTEFGKIGEGDLTPSTPLLEKPQKMMGYTSLNGVCTKLANGNPFQVSEGQMNQVLNDVKTLLVQVNERTSGGTQTVQGKNSPNTSLASSPDKLNGKVPLWGKGTTNVLFDIYSLMALMLECAQKQKAAEREVRHSYKEQIVTSIQNQADKQNRAAMIGLIAGSIICALQVANAGYQLKQQISAARTEVKLNNDFGVGDADAKMTATNDTLKMDMQKLEAFEAEHGKVMDEPMGIDNPQNKSGQPEVGEPDKFEPKNIAKVEKQDGGEHEGENLDSVKKVEENNLNIKVNNGEKQANMDNVAEDNIQAKVDNNQGDVKKHEVADADDGFEAKGNKADGLKLKKAAEESAQKAAKAQRDFENAVARMKASPRYQAMKMQDAKAQRWSEMGTALGNLGQNLVKGFVEMEQAEATLMGVLQKHGEEGLDEAKDLMGNTQEVINKCISLFQAVLSAENDSMSNIIRMI